MTSTTQPQPNLEQPAATGPRHRTALLGALWPLGLALTLAVTAAAPPFAVTAAVELLYLAAACAAFRMARADLRDPAARLALVGVVLFASVSLSGPPSADEPGLMTLNTAGLLVVAVLLLTEVTRLVWRHRASPAAPGAAAALLLLTAGTAGYLMNLAARLAVHLTGAAPQQAAVEDTHWVAYSYLRGLDGPADWMAYLLTWLDLVQLGYVLTAYLATAALARLLRAEGVVSRRAGTGTERVAQVLAAVLVLGVAAAPALPRELDAVPAWAAFVVSIPFMTTVLPFVLGVSAVAQAGSGAGGRSAWTASQAMPPSRASRNQT